MHALRSDQEALREMWLHGGSGKNNHQGPGNHTELGGGAQCCK